MRSSFLILPVLLVGIGLAVASPAGIAWHEGDVQAAFDRARTEDKPLFLYWGAVWCPPCNQIKKTIFTRREFIDRSKLFIPVYLDGDTDRAQVWADKLDVSGYPSMLVMNSQGHEVMRLPTGLQLEEFVEVLDEALNRVTPVAEVLEGALAAPDPNEVPDRAYRLIAYHAWRQDHQLELSTEEMAARFRTLADRIPARLERERSRLFVQWLSRAAELATRKPTPDARRIRLGRKQRREAAGRLQEILASPELTTANLEFLTWEAVEIVPVLYPRKGNARTALVEDLVAAMRRVEADESFSVDERLSALLPAIAAHRLQKGEEAPLDAALREHVLARVAWADESAQDAYTRQAALSSAGYVLRRAGLTDEARRLYLAEIEKSESPFYFMSSLASMAQGEGDFDEAVRWLSKAYDTSSGRATRFQWGVNYLIGLMEMVPDDGERIRAESQRILQEMLGFDDAFAGRNFLRIQWLDEAFREWNAAQAHAVEIASLRETMLPACADLAGDLPDVETPQRERCETFFDELGNASP